MNILPKRVGKFAGPLVAAAAWSILKLAGCGEIETAVDMSAGDADGGIGTGDGGAGTGDGGAGTGDGGAGTGDGGTGTGDGGTGTGDGGTGTPVSQGTTSNIATIDRPLAAVLSPDGKTVYLTARDALGNAQLYSVLAAGGTPTLIPSSSPLGHPLGLAIAPDGAQLYVADSVGGPEGGGSVYTISPSGTIGTAKFTGIRGPAGIAVSSDGMTVYVTGFDAADNKPGLFSAASSGGAVTSLAKGVPFSNPSAVTLTADGTLYVVDTTARGPKQGAVIKVSGGSASVFTTQPLIVGFPAGISPVGGGSNDLLITGNRGLGNGVVYSVSTVGAVAPLTLSNNLFDPATIYRAANASTWVVVDSVNATNMDPGQQVGSIFVLSVR